MTKGVKIAVGCLVALLAVCVLSAALMFFAGAWVKNKLSGFWGGAMDAGKSVQSIQKLDAAYPFAEPADGLLREDRLQAFIAVCGKVKPHYEALQAFNRQHSGDQQGSVKAVGEGMTLVANITKAMLEGLQEQQMSPREFDFVKDAMARAGRSAPTGGAAEAMAPDERNAAESQIRAFEGLLSSPNLPEEQRQEIQGQIERLRVQLGETGTAGDPNAELYRKYETKLREVYVEGMEAVAFRGKAF